MKQATKYVDGYVIVVRKNNLPAYRRMAKDSVKVWLKYGALDYKECVGDDLNVEWGAPFTKLLKLKRNETVIFSYIAYKSRAHRDIVNAKVYNDPVMNDPKYQQLPFDMKRMYYGGFKIMVSS